MKSTISCLTVSIFVYLSFAGLASQGMSQTVIQEKPLVFFLIFDDTASMGRRSSNPAAESWGVKIDDVRRQSSKFFKTVPVGTDLNLYSFSNTLTRGGRVIISSDTETVDRNKAIEFLNGLKVKGEQTRFWWALEQVLNDAADYIKKNPNAIVRVIAYTDGLDNDPHRKNPADVLKKHERLLRKKNVELTYVAIGFELSDDDQKLLKAAKVEVRTAMKPAELIPVPMPIASFRVSSEKIELGETITVVNESTGDGLSSQWRLGDSKTNHQRHPSVTPSKIGDFELILTITDSLGRTAECRKPIKVVPKPVPVANFATVAPTVYIHQRIKCINRTPGTADRFEWFINDVATSTEKDLNIEATETGVHSIRLVAHTGTESTTTKSTVEVLPLELPKVQILGVRHTQFQKSVTLNCSIETTDKTSPVSNVDWYQGEEKIVSGNSLEASGVSVGDFDYRCVVVTADGNVEATHRLTVIPPPRPTVELVVPRSVYVDDGVVFKPSITGKCEQVRYFIDETLQPEQGAEFPTSFTDSRKHIVRVEAEGPGGIATASSEITVLPHPLPVAAFEFGTSNPRVGDEVTLIDHSKNAELVEWFVGEGKVLLARRDYSSGDDPIVKFVPTTEEKTIVYQVVHGKGGTSETSLSITALPKLIAPQSTVQHRLIKTNPDGSREFEFAVSAVGRVEGVSVDDGDGLKPVELTSNCFFATWEPGEREVKVQISGLSEFNPETHEFEIRIPKPWPQWTRHLWWITPLCLACLAASVFGFRKASEMKSLRDSQMIFGTLRYRATSDDFGDWDEISFNGEKQKEPFFLKNGQAASLQTAFNQVDGSTSFLLTLSDGEVPGTEVEIGSNEVVVVGGHEFCFSRFA